MKLSKDEYKNEQLFLANLLIFSWAIVFYRGELQSERICDRSHLAKDQALGCI
ncbi:hypothetical protein ACP2W0_08130 [Pseudobacillus badius]|uniref:hypothetical protein n=1 Tax=Bacillus badius TaxID=1455 RepID=UPI003CE7C12B